VTPEKTKECFQQLKHLMSVTSITECLPGDKKDNLVSELLMWEVLGHLRYMCEEGVKLVDQNRTEKAMRWLGFIQGAMWGLGYTSIGAMKELNKPDNV
jgi:hypothetical protein